ncbi:hypothetical protein KL86DYS2_11008 [uncultured Dysgonomonas sp.]|uniref:Uncharacterized protein n=1 Tax=uncultured Dysgonomonas sp. TaxID=206096 RepID=A0A212J950_9BACT|nr:hypothetical protein KL86DYS2_11008 [uncultured Dysgonomonas sp.]
MDNAIVIYDTLMSQQNYDRLANLTGMKQKNAKHLEQASYVR